MALLAAGLFGLAALGAEPPARCPAPSKALQATCAAITYKDLPDGAKALLRRLKCDVGPDSNYDYGSSVDLNGDGSLEYQFCCREAPHGPCQAVLIGKIGNKWKDLTSKEGLLGYDGPCNLFVVLESRHSGYHDICLPGECAPAAPKPGSNSCPPAVWQFENGSYRAIAAPDK